MATLRQLRTRIRSLRNTQQITRAMKMVAAAKIRRAELAMRAARPYAKALTEMLEELASTPGVDHPLLKARDVKRRGILLLTADKGLAGAFNSNLVRAAIGYAMESGAESSIYTVGTKARVMLKRAPYQLRQFWALQSKPFPELAKELAQRVSTDFLDGRVDEVTLISSRFVATVVQRPTVMRLLPVRRPEKPIDRSKNAYEFEPDNKHVLAALLPKYVEFTIFQALLETQASEFAARLMAMTNATDNAGKLIDELTLAMNQTRQASITKEILEIAAGAEALKG